MTTIHIPDPVTVKLDHVLCGVCHINFAIPSEMSEARQRDGRTFHCPNGDVVSWSDNELTRAKKALQAKNDEAVRLRAQLDQREARVRTLVAETDSLTRKVAARKGVTTRLKRRLTNGQCPCCSRKFKDLKTHMASAHPKYDVEKEAAAREASAGV
jgi:hypothetical protein